jgi:putative membrane protein
MEDVMNNFMRVAVLSALLGVGSAWAEGLAKADQKMLTDLAMANMAEIETAKLALQKTQSDRIKSFAQQMVDDHTKGLEEVRKVAAARSVTLPSELDAKHKAMAAKLDKLSGDKFDRSYMEQAGVKSHKEAHALVSKTESSAQDSELKALATRLQPTIHQHLNNAEQLNAAIKGATTVGSSGTQGSSGSSAAANQPPDEASNRSQGTGGGNKPDAGTSSTRPERR